MTDVKPPSTLVITKPDGSQVVVPVVGLLRPDGTVIDPTDVNVSVPEPLQVFSTPTEPLVIEPSVANIARSLGSTSVPEPFAQALTDVGDGTGTRNIVGNYGSDTEFKLTPAGPGQVVLVRAIRVVVSVAETDLRSNRWGDGGALVAPDGVKLEARDTGGVLFDLMAGERVRRNRDWPQYGNTVIVSFRKADTLVCTFVAIEQPLILRGSDVGELVYTVRGDMTGLDLHSVTAIGWKVAV